MKKLLIFVAALLLPSALLAQASNPLPNIRSGDNKILMRAQPVQVFNGDGTPVSSTATPTGPAGTPSTSVVTVQGISGGTPQAVSGTAASGSPVSGNPVLVAGSDGTNARTLNVNTAGTLRVGGPDPNGTATNPNPTIIGGYDGANIRSIRTDTTGSVFTVTGGTAAHDAVDSGQPVKIGGYASATAPTAVSASGDRVNAWYGLTGNAAVFLTDSSGNAFSGVQPQDGQTTSPNTLAAKAYGMVFNGTTWDRQRGSTFGAFSIITDPAGNQPVARSGSADAVSSGVGLLVTSQQQVFNGSTFDRMRGDSVGTYMIPSPTASANNGLVPVATTAVASAIVLKASFGNLYGLNVVSGASAGYVMVFNSASVPDGAVTPVKCWAIAANTSAEWNFRNMPLYFSTAISAVFSTTGCFTKTASVTAYISGDVK